MPTVDPTHRYTYAQFAAVRRYQLMLTLAPDGAQVAYSTNISGQFNLWRQASAGGYPHQITFYTDQAVRDAAWAPRGEQIVYTADRQGDEYHQLYQIPARGGQPTPLTAAPRAQHYLAREPWSPDGRYFAYCGNDREPADMDVLIRDMESGEVRRLLDIPGWHQPVAWSPDGSRLTVAEPLTTSDSNIHLLSVADGTARLITPHEGDAQYTPGPWAADGSGFYFVSDEGREFAGLAFYDLQAARYRWVETPEWDVEDVAVSPDGHFLAWTVNEDGYSRLYLRDLRSGERVDPPALPAGVIYLLRFAAQGDKLGLLLGRPTGPTEVYVLDLAAGHATQLTYSMLGGIDEADLAEPELIRYPTHDGRTIPAFLYRPRGAGPFPVVLSVHGGPEAQERPAYAYSGLYQYLLNRGIGVLATNIRGSTGYGKTYQHLIHRDWGGGELGDLEAAAQYLHTLPWVDPARLGVFGGSFGGFATLSCLTRLPAYWAAGVDIVGPSNLVTFLKAVPPTWRRFLTSWLGDPDTEADFLLSRSPISYVDAIQAPLFIIQGANDPRVVQSESDQMVERLRARGIDVKYDVYADEGHGFTRRENELRAFGDATEFLERYLLPAAG